jgi:hypothetical protein
MMAANRIELAMLERAVDGGQLLAALEAIVPGDRNWLTADDRLVHELRGPSAVTDGEGTPIVRMQAAVYTERPDRTLLTWGGNPHPGIVQRFAHYFMVPEASSLPRVAWCTPEALLHEPLSPKQHREAGYPQIDEGRFESAGVYHRIFGAWNHRALDIYVRWLTRDLILLLGSGPAGLTILPRYMLEIMAIRPPTTET